MKLKSCTLRPRMAAKERRIGVDTGGTFTDVFVEAGAQRRVVKVPSTPSDPAQAVEAGLLALGDDAKGARVVHGTTVGLNALLTRRLGRADHVQGRARARGRAARRAGVERTR